MGPRALEMGVAALFRTKYHRLDQEPLFRAQCSSFGILGELGTLPTYFPLPAHCAVASTPSAIYTYAIPALFSFEPPGQHGHYMLPIGLQPSRMTKTF